jgi:hypothetical protein
MMPNFSLAGAVRAWKSDTLMEGCSVELWIGMATKRKYPSIPDGEHIFRMRPREDPTFVHRCGTLRVHMHKCPVHPRQSVLQR